MTKLALAGAVCFGFWGLLHLAGGGAILLAALGSGDAGFAFYQGAGSGYDPLSVAILQYFAFGIATLGAVAGAIAVLGNRRNLPNALMANTVLVGLTELGLVLFLLVPGFVPVVEALPGLVLAVAGIVLGGMACRAEDAHAAA